MDLAVPVTCITDRCDDRVILAILPILPDGVKRTDGSDT